LRKALPLSSVRFWSFIRRRATIAGIPARPSTATGLPYGHAGLIGAILNVDEALQPHEREGEPDRRVLAFR
jgi:hypothetical protein